MMFRNTIPDPKGYLSILIRITFDVDPSVREIRIWLTYGFADMHIIWFSDCFCARVRRRPTIPLSQFICLPFALGVSARANARGENRCVWDRIHHFSNHAVGCVACEPDWSNVVWTGEGNDVNQIRKWYEPWNIF